MLKQNQKLAEVLGRMRILVFRKKQIERKSFLFLKAKRSDALVLS